MNPLKLLRDRIVIGRKTDEAFHAAALSELQSGKKRPGLMAKAMAECGGDEKQAQVAYFRLLVTAIKDDHYLAHRAAKANESAQAPPKEPSEGLGAIFQRDLKTGLLRRHTKPGFLTIDWIVGAMIIVFIVLLFSSAGP